MENEQRDEAGAGRNPGYKGPPLKRWHTVEVVAAVGTEFGVVQDKDSGVLTIITRRVGEAWPHGMEPTAGGENRIEPGYRVYCVRSDDQGADLNTWQQFAAYCRSCALSGEDNPMDFDAFVKYTFATRPPAEARSGT